MIQGRRQKEVRLVACNSNPFAVVGVRVPLEFVRLGQTYYTGQC